MALFQKFQSRKVMLLCFISLFAVCRAGANVTVKCYTHNVSYLEREAYGTNLEALCTHATHRDSPDILAFGFQEARITLRGPGEKEKKMEGKKSFEHVKRILTTFLSRKDYVHVASKRVEGETGNISPLSIVKKIVKACHKDPEEGIFLHIFSKRDVVEVTNDDAASVQQGTGGRRGSGRRGSLLRLKKMNAKLPNKGSVFLKLNVTKDGVFRTMGFLCCHNSCNNAFQNGADFKIANEIVKKADCDVVFSLGDFNPRVECKESKEKGWFREIDGKEYQPLVESLNAIIRDPTKSTEDFRKQQLNLDNIKQLIDDKNVNNLKNEKAIVIKDEKKYQKWIDRAVNISKRIEERREGICTTCMPRECIMPFDTFHDLVRNNNWNEMDIHFRPSYCYQPESSTPQEIKKKRNLTMSHADRIIWKIAERSDCTVDGLEYRSIVDDKDLEDCPGVIDVSDLQGSDHQPVYGTFIVHFAEPTERSVSLIGEQHRRLAGYRKLPAMESLLELIREQQN